MEHEDNAQFDNYLQSAQQQNLQLGNNTTGNGDALVGLGLGLNVDANMVGCGGAIGEVGKFDDVEDENELKYIKEVNQSEKEQAAVGNGRNHQDAMHDDVDDDDDDEDDYDNEGMPSMQYRNNSNDEHHNGATKDDFDALHNDVGDFSQTSNTASTADGGCVDMLQVEMKIEPLQQQQQQQQQHAFDEEDPSSNGTSSLSENAPMPQQLASTFDFLSDNADLLQQNKENTDPDKLSASPVPRPTELNFEVHGSHLNPDAKEFVPSCGSNATSPTMSETADVEHVGEPVEQPLSALPRHRLLSGDDDVVARSPRKGREMNMDADNLVLPDSELDFDNEAQKRPHEFEQDEDLMGSNCVEIAQSPINEVEAEPEPEPQPELEPELNDVMKQSIYLAENGDIQQHEALENVLNSVQPLPTDIESLNSSFAEDVYAGTPEEMRAIDLLGHEIEVDEEHTSHPPSIEEMQMNLQNVKNKDEANNMNLDMNSAAHMQESFYMEKHEQEQEHAINDNKQQQQQEEPEDQQEEEKEHNDDGFYAQQFAANESLLMDTSIPAFSAEHNQSIDKQFINNDDFSGNAKVLDYDEQNIVTNMSSPSPKSTVEEKHLMEETKEQLVAKTIQDGQQFVEELGKKMENLLSTGIDCDLKQESATVTQIEEPTQFQNDAFEQQQFEQIVNEHENELLPKTEQQPTEKIEQVEAASEIAPTAATIDVESAEIAAAAAVIATTAVAAAAVTAAQTDKKAETTTKKAAVKPAAAPKSSTSTAAKKPITKTTTSTTASAAATRPRTAPAKVASSTVSKTSVASSTAAKKPTTGTTAAASKTSLPAKPLASKPSTTSRVSLTAKSSTSTTTTTTARKPLTTATSSTSTAASAAKTARPASAQPTKSTMSVTAAKPKISPRATLTSQLRNKVSPAAPANATSTTKATTVKSPTKASAGSDATASKVASATRVKSATSTTAAGTTSTTKLFTARPAPKTTTTSSVRSVTARTVSKTSPLKTSPRAVASTLKAKAATTKDATKSPAKDTRKTPTKVGGKDAENKQKENVVAQMNGVEEKVGNENIQLQNGSVEVEKVTPLEIDGQV